MPKQEKEKASDKKYRPKHEPNAILKYSGMAFQMAAIILIFTLIGKKLDAHFGMEKPTITLIFALLSVIIALYLNLKDIIFNKE